MGIRTALAATALVLLLTAPAAEARDRDVWRAFASHLPKLNRLERASERSSGALERKHAGRRAVARFVSTRQRVIVERGRITVDVKSQSPSTRHGVRAKRCLLHEQFWARRESRHEIAVVYAARSGHRARAFELLGVAFIDILQQARYEKCRSSAFDAIGYSEIQPVAPSPRRTAAARRSALRRALLHLASAQPG